MSHYRESQARIDEAEAALREGDDVRARALYGEAARLQGALLDEVPADRVRTRSVYGLSVATLLHRAGDLDGAARLAQELLAEPWIEAHSAGGLRLLLDRIESDRGASAPRVRPARLGLRLRRSVPVRRRRTSGP